MTKEQEQALQFVASLMQDFIKTLPSSAVAAVSRECNTAMTVLSAACLHEEPAPPTEPVEAPE